MRRCPGRCVQHAAAARRHRGPSQCWVRLQHAQRPSMSAWCTTPSTYSGHQHSPEPGPKFSRRCVRSRRWSGRHAPAGRWCGDLWVHPQFLKTEHQPVGPARRATREVLAKTAAISAGRPFGCGGQGCTTPSRSTSTRAALGPVSPCRILAPRSASPMSRSRRGRGRSLHVLLTGAQSGTMQRSHRHRTRLASCSIRHRHPILR